MNLIIAVEADTRAVLAVVTCSSKPEMEEEMHATEDGFRYVRVRGPARRSNTCTMLIVGGVAVLCLIVLVFAVAVAVGVALGIRGCGSTLECLSASVRRNMDTSVNPCIDFYQYSCGGWNARNPVSAGAITRFGEVVAQNTKSLRNVIESGRDGDVRAVQLAKRFYDSCMDTGRLDAMGSRPLVQLVKSMGGWSLLNIFNNTASSWSINGADFIESHARGNPAFFTMNVVIDPKDSSRHITQMTQSGLTLPSPELYENEQYTDSLVQLIDNVLSLLGPSTYYSEASDIVDIEKDLARIFVSSEVRDPNARYNPVTQQMSHRYWTQFDWSSYVSARFSRIGIVVPETLIVNVATPSYFTRLTQVYSQHSSSQWENYFKWQLIYRYILFLGTYHLQTVQKFRQTIEGVAVDSNRASTCVSALQTVVPYTLARLYAKYILPDGTRDEMNETADAIITAFKDDLRTNTWLDQTTIDASIEKVNAVTKNVAYPEFVFDDAELLKRSKSIEATGGAYFDTFAYFVNEDVQNNLAKLNQPVDRNQWISPPTIVNALYYPPLNKIEFEEGILNNPFIMAGWPSYFQFGAIGVVAGHELSHGFDDQGHQYNKDGNLVQWWTNASLNAFNQRAQCFVNQYSGYNLQEEQINGQRTLGENIADNGGLKTAYRAYKNSLASSHTTVRLPGVDLTPDQVFFIAFSQLWCTAITESSLRISIATDPHSPGPIRVRGSVSNSAEFATAFNCPVGSPMNPATKCVLWG